MVLRQEESASGEFGEKSSKFFLNLEKQHALLNQVRTPHCFEKEVTDKHKINQELECFYKNPFTEKLQFKKKRRKCLSQVKIPFQTWEGPITESEVLNALKNMRNNKSPGNDGLTEKLYET